MTLKKGKKAISKNIAMLVNKEKRPQKQAVAIAMKMAGKHKTMGVEMKKKYHIPNYKK